MISLGVMMTPATFAKGIGTTAWALAAGCGEGPVDVVIGTSCFALLSGV